MPRGDGERLPKVARLRKRDEIVRVLRSGRRIRSGPVEVIVTDSTSDRSRVAVVVPRHGRTIVERNRLKRRLREILRREWLPRAGEAGVRLDLVLRPGAAAYDTPFQDVRRYLRETFESLC